MSITPSSSHAQPEPRGKLSSESAPQVVVRAGKTYVCSACGTLVEVPADVVGQLVMVVDSSPADVSAETPGPSKQPTQVEPGQRAPRAKSSSAKDSPRPSYSPIRRPPRPSRPSATKQARFVGETIDGLAVPRAEQLDRALAWVSFHLKVLDRQGSEIRRLKKLLKSRTPDPVPGQRSHGHAMEVDLTGSHEPSVPQPANHAHQDVSMVSESCQHETKERGPP